MADVRPDWRTIARRGPHPTAIASTDGTCPHGHEVLEHEPIVLLDTTTDQAPDGRRVVDLSGADWHPHQCIGAPS